MKKLVAMMFVATLTVACGVQEGEVQDPPSNNDPGTTDPGTTDPIDVDGPTYPAVVTSPAPGTLCFAQEYVSGSKHGEIRGDLPGMSWGEGPVILPPAGDDDGTLCVSLEDVAEGSYSFSYTGDVMTGEGWAMYGSEAQLVGMGAEARAWVHCDWSCGSNGSCGLAANVDANGTFTPAGNMAGFTGCD